MQIKWFQNFLNKHPIRKSLITIFILFILLPFTFISVFHIHYLYNTLMDAEINKVKSSYTDTEEKLTMILEKIVAFSDRLYVNKQIQSVLTKKYSDIREVYADYTNLTFLEDYLRTYDEVENFRFYTDNQALLDNSFIVKATWKLKTELWYDTALRLKGAPFWTIKKDSVNKKEYLSLVRSVWNTSNGRFIGVLCINLDGEVIEKQLHNQFFDTSIVFNKRILYSNNKQMQARDRAQLLSVFEESHNLEIQTIDFMGKKTSVMCGEFFPAKTEFNGFGIIYLIPLEQMIDATLEILFLSSMFFIIMIFILFLFILTFTRYVTNRVKKLQYGISNVVQKNFEIPPSIGGKDEFEQIYSKLYEMSCDIKELIEQVYTQNIEKEQLAAKQNEIRYKMLATQINPHFLFNTLETIRMKSLASGEKEVAMMLKLLASLLRYNLSVEGKPVPLITELDAIQNYLNIQHIRFGERISFDVVTTCDVQNQMILPLLIQPLVENSISHGLENTISGGFIYIFITSDEESDDIIITVKDNGTGMSQEKLDELNAKINLGAAEDYTSSIGLVNVNSRIKIYYGKDYGMTIASKEGEGTTVTIRVKKVSLKS